MFPTNFTTLPSKQPILDTYKGAIVDTLPTPSFVIDRTKFKANCIKMLHNAESLQADFRAHVKTHKTIEGTRIQVSPQPGLSTDKLVVSTLMEAWNLLPLVEEGGVTDILFSLPVVRSRLDELAQLSTKVPHLRLMLDNPEQLDLLASRPLSTDGDKPAQKWSVFIKINMGTNRAGLLNDSQYLSETLARFHDVAVSSAVEIYGFYCHAGHSYASDSPNAAKGFLMEEIRHANMAAKAAKDLFPDLNLQISVGATPTAHASEILTMDEVTTTVGPLYGKLELHAGNYPCLDLQQVSTGCVTLDDVSCKVVAEVLSTYRGRGGKGPGEQLINAGVIALAREFGPLPGHGRIVEPKGYDNWIVGRLSQEHGILVPLEDKPTELIPLGTRVSVVPQHSCITAAAYPWYYVVEGDVVVDVWVPFRGW
ncbi:D-serine dehydratase [[Candida] jaroonii]|uniref:D-serine dehydratase n=1 Tax=[Candida] jaroonii TaxID=467808 RepID=A0ACA9Y9A9_9ASCO|nr:D-serine dehydratase [[Candida] jaroonii]